MSPTQEKIEILEFFSWEEKLQSQTEQIKAKAPTQQHCTSLETQTLPAGSVHKDHMDLLFV